MLFDTHAHYDDERFDEDRDKVLKNAYAGGVSLILNAGTDIPSSEQSVALAKAYSFVYAAVGIHPHEAGEAGDAALDALKKLAAAPKVVAIGEIGLDYHYDFAPRDVQKQWFSRQIELAVELKLPVIVHNREAHEDSMDIVKSANAREVGGVFHCYSGSIEMARELLNNNFYISIGGPVTFKNAKKSIEVVKYIPDDRLLIETDCPYLTPEPYRGKRNNSAYVQLVAEKIAEIKGTTLESIAALTLENGRRLFNILH